MEIIGELKHFFENPDMVREVAMHQHYDQCNFTERGIYSGLRSEINVNSPIYIELKTKIQKLISKEFREFNCHFHINPNGSCLGFPHTDTNTAQNHIAGVVYLNKEHPNECGTTLFHSSSIYNSLDHEEYLAKMQIAYSLQIPSTNKIKQQIVDECVHFKTKVLQKKKNFTFEYNKLVYYDGSILHSPDFYFGNNISNSRLTVVFHSKVNA